MKQRRSVSLILAISMVFLSSCIIVEVNEPEWSGTAARKPFQKTLPLKSGGTVAIENVSGGIDIRGWEREEVEVTAEGMGGRPVRKGVGTRGLGGSEPGIRVDAKEDTVQISSRSETGDDVSRDIDFSLRVPRSVNLRDVVNGEGDVHISDLFGRVVLDVKEGQVAVENFSGSLDLAVLNGDIQAEVLDLRGEDVVKIVVKKGDITLGLQEGVRVRIDAEALDGEISSELDLGQPLPSRKLTARTAEGGASVSLKALEGDIRILKVE